MTRTFRTEQPEELTLKIYLVPVDLGEIGDEEGYTLTETLPRQYEIEVPTGFFGRYRVTVEMVSVEITANIDSGYVDFGSADGVYVMQNKLPELSTTPETSDDTYTTYGPKRVKTKEMEIEQFSPDVIQRVQERESATLPTFCSGPACIGSYKNEKCPKEVRW